MVNSITAIVSLMCDIESTEIFKSQLIAIYAVT